jgi:hypothetical protein
MCHLLEITDLQIIIYTHATAIFGSLTYVYIHFSFSLALQPRVGYGHLVLRGFLNIHNDAPQSVGPLWTSDQLVLDTSTWQHTTHTTNIRAPGGIFFLIALVSSVSCTFVQVSFLVLSYCVLWIFPLWKIRRLRSGANPRSWVPEASTQTPRPPKPLRIRTHDRSGRAAVDLRLRPRRHWDRQRIYILKWKATFRTER